MNEKQLQLKIDFLVKELEELGGFTSLFKEVHKSIYERMLNSTNLEQHTELYYIIKSLKEVESVIQESANRVDKHIQEID